MFLLHRPSASAIRRFLDASRELPLSYDPPGLLDRPIAAGHLDEQLVTIGRGRRDFERARQALTEWRHFDIGWVQAFPDRPSLEAGVVVAVLIRHLGFWSLNGARVLPGPADDRTSQSFGYAYGALTNHAESGEERFDVRLDPSTGDVTFGIRAVSWPQSLLSWIGQPIVRQLQAQFRRDSAAAMAAAVGTGQVLSVALHNRE
jgi:uncharacterized protein (UPF0548 family)